MNEKQLSSPTRKSLFRNCKSPLKKPNIKEIKESKAEKEGESSFFIKTNVYFIIERLIIFLKLLRITVKNR